MADDLTHQTGVYEDAKDTTKDGEEGEVRAWLERIDLASDEEKDWRRDVDDAEATFDAEEGQEGTSFNLYHANVQTLVPALYNTPPTPDVRRRFSDDDPVAKEAAQAIERGLGLAIDAYDFDTSIKQTVFDLALPGRGVARATYKAPVTTDAQGYEDIAYQEVGCAHVAWEDFRRGPGLVWEQVPWVAFKHHFTRKALRELGSKVAKKIPLNSNYSGNEDTKKPAPSVMKTAAVWEIWDKETRRVLYVCPDYQYAFVHVVDDPLDLENFFPIPRPMYSTPKARKLVPLCEYTVYKNLLIELDDITDRIRRLVRQLRPRALSALKTADAEGLAKADDGEILEVSDVGAFLDSGGLEKMLAWFPLDPIVKALAQLYIQRDNVKVQIYEVTGMADVMRGQTNPNETAAAQELKAQWGSLRIQERQQEVQRFIRDLFRIKAEIMCQKYTPETWALILGVPLSQQALQVMQSDAMRLLKVDIETDSTIQGDSAKNQKQMAEFTNGMGLMLQSLAPAIQMGVIDPVTSAVMIQALARKFKLGKQVEDAFDSLVQQAQMKMQQPPQPSPEQQKAQADAQAQQQELQFKAQESGMKMQAEQAKMGMEQQKHQQQMAHDAEKHQMSIQLEREKMGHQLGIEREKMGHQAQIEQHKMANQSGLEREKMDRSDTIERERMSRDDSRSDKEMAFQRDTKASEILMKELDDRELEKRKKKDASLAEAKAATPMQEIRSSFEMLAQAVQGLTAMSQAMVQTLGALKEAVEAPAELITDSNGRPVGARKVLNGDGRTLN